MKTEIMKILNSDESNFKKITEIRKILHEYSDVKEQPVDHVQWVPIDMVQANDYNPNSVARKELQLLYISILKDGYTQPVVTVWDSSIGKYVIIDGFHRYFVCRNNKDIRERNHGLLPVVVLDKDINDRMASTVRHNRARGKHSVKGMSSMAFKLLNNGWSDADICNELGMEAEELTKIKHITGFSKLFEDVEYCKAWESKRQIQLRKMAEKHPDWDAKTLNKNTPK